MQQHFDGAVVLSVSGEVDLANEPLLRGDLKAAIETGKQLIVVDMKDLRYIDLSGINALLDASRAVAHNGCSIVLAAVPPTAQRILKIIGLEQAIPIFLTVEMALNGKAKPGAGNQSPPAPNSL